MKSSSFFNKKAHPVSRNNRFNYRFQSLLGGLDAFNNFTTLYIALSNLRFSGLTIYKILVYLQNVELYFIHYIIFIFSNKIYVICINDTN